MLKVTPPARVGALDAHYAALVESALDSIVSTDLDGIVLSWNRAAERMFGWSAAEMIGSPIRAILPPDRYDEEPQILSRIRAGEQVGKFETVRQHRDGRVIPVALTISPMTNEKGEVVGASKIAHEISEMLAIRARVVNSEEQFRTLADSIPQLLWVSDDVGKVIWFNQRWFEYTGTSFEEACDYGWMKIPHPDHLEQIKETLRAAAETGQEWELTFPLRGRDGEYRWFLSRATPVRGADGRIVRWVGANTDITDKILHEEQIQMLMGEVHHRAKNMIAVVQALVQRTAAPEYAKGLISRLHALSRNLDILTNRNWTGAAIGELIRSQLAVVGDLVGGRVLLDGDLGVVINRSAAEALGLTIHELATNATKYGALSQDHGQVRIHCALSGEGADQKLIIDWREQGGPAVRNPTSKGFGTTMIDRNPRFAMSAQVEYGYPENGFFWRLTAPFERVRPEQGTIAAKLSADPAAP